ncbi:alpha/beta hydrolase [Nonomuraea sp. NN258]|uniref:alpha/beta hydrolase n=1 Tax=Nonomuraea antri TaxID=2730852 RepID=UPI001568F77A|nr:alpha/beta hydrolase [Nonomuraea antri]NRQ34117.1 alpha/beta hydrolase [Nonomuraea antri]
MYPETVHGWPTRAERDPDRVALLFHGRFCVPARPLIQFAAQVLGKHGWTTQEVWWEPPAQPEDDDPAWVHDQVGAALAAESASTLLLLGKSLSSLAAPLAAERGLPAIWLTPLLHRPLVVEGLARAKAPALLVGGTADPSWRPGTIRDLPLEVLELPNADHGLGTDDPIESAAMLRRVTAAVDAFAGGLRT